MTNCPPSLRGDLSKWLCEINTGVYVGNVSSRVRDAIWDRVCENLKNGQATLVFILERMVHDVRWLLLNEEEQAAEPEAVYLWDSKIGTVANGVNYFDAEEGEEPSLS